MYYLRPYLIKERDDRERRELARRIKDEEKLTGQGDENRMANNR